MNNDHVWPHSLFSADDLHLFRAGKHYRLYRHFGAQPCRVQEQDGLYFAVWAPAASQVSVIGNFNGWQGESHPLYVRWDGSGIWEGFIPGLSLGETYKYRLVNGDSGEVFEKADPFARRAEHPPKTASLAHRDDYVWGDQEWLDKRANKQSLQAPMSVYEMHLGSWRRHHDRPFAYREIADTLVPYLLEAGFSHVEFMPVMEFPYEPSWGYQITGYFAASSRFGPPEDLKYLIDQLHQAGIGVILDWVPSHFPADAHGLGRFDGSAVYEHPDARRGYHPDWKSLIFNYGRPEVQSFLISNALFWLDEYHVDALRVDAVASMLYLDYSREEGQWEANVHGGNENLEAIAFLREFNTAVYQYYPGIQSIAEESTSFSGVTRPVHEGGLGFGLKWMMGWMNDNLRYFERDPLYRGFHHNEISFSLAYAFSENFMLPLSHDEVVYGKQSLLSKMPGDDWQQFANLRLLLSWQFLHPGAKLLFQGGEFGQRGEWNYSEGLQWQEKETEAHGGVFRCVQKLNQLYRSEKALYAENYRAEGFQWIEHQDRENTTLSFIRQAGAEQLVVLLNCSPIPRHDYEIGLPQCGHYELIFNSDASPYWGSNYASSQRVSTYPQARHGFAQAGRFILGPLAAQVYRCLPDSSAAQNPLPTIDAQAEAWKKGSS